MPQQQRRPVVHSRCTQVHVTNVCAKAVSIVSQKSSSGEIPLVIIPSRRSPLSLMMEVPSGVTCLLQKFGADMGAADPGLHFVPSWWRIAYVVSNQANTYDAPVLACPTSDDVMVNIDVVLIFRINDAQKFVYKLGAQNFDDFLSGTVDEAIRMLVRTQTHKTVYWLRGDRAKEMLPKLNQVFEGSGVIFSDVKITAVWLPNELASTLENTTIMEKKMDKLRRQNEYEMVKINMENAMQIEEITRKLEQTLVAEKGRATRAELEFDQRKVKAEEDGRVALIQAESIGQVEHMATQTQLNRTKVTLNTLEVQQTSKAKEYDLSTRKAAELDSEVRELGSLWKEHRMRSEAYATKHDSTAEKEASKGLIAARKHELDLREKEILAKLAETGNFNLVGTSGDRLVAAMMTGKLEM